MSMDAAHYINTLKHTAPRAVAPQDYDFAVLDLASSDTLLEEIYAGMTDEKLQWWSLFEGTSWQSDWSNGPVLVDVRTAPNFRTRLSSRLESKPLGLVFKSNLSTDETRQHLAHWLTESNPGTEQLLRFYEPRMFAPLLCVLANQRRQNLLSAGALWHWYDTHHWRQSIPNEEAKSINDKLEQILVTPQELQRAEPYWLAGEACGYATYYAEALPQAELPECWVFDSLCTAKNVGFDSADHMERWLRMAIQHGPGFHLTEPIHLILSNGGLPASDRLIAMESLLEKTDANNL